MACYCLSKPNLSAWSVLTDSLENILHVKTTSCCLYVNALKLKQKQEQRNPDKTK